MTRKLGGDPAGTKIVPKRMLVSTRFIRYARKDSSFVRHLYAKLAPAFEGGMGRLGRHNTDGRVAQRDPQCDRRVHTFVYVISPASAVSEMCRTALDCASHKRALSEIRADLKKDIEAVQVLGQSIYELDEPDGSRRWKPTGLDHCMD